MCLGVAHVSCHRTMCDIQRRNKMLRVLCNHGREPAAQLGAPDHAGAVGVELAEAGPLAKLHVGVHLDQRDAVLLQQDDME